MIEEIWKDIPGWEGSYQVSSLGRVRSIDRMVTAIDGKVHHRKGRFLKPRRTDRNYLNVVLSKTKSYQPSIRIHRLVALAFIGPPPDPKMEINHKNGVRDDNRVENIEWVTKSENVKHAFRIGLRCWKGENHPTSKLTENQVLEIKRLIRDGLGNTEIAKRYNVKHYTISKIRTGDNWPHVSLPEDRALHSHPQKSSLEVRRRNRPRTPNHR